MQEPSSVGAAFCFILAISCNIITQGFIRSPLQSLFLRYLHHPTIRSLLPKLCIPIDFIIRNLNTNFVNLIFSGLIALQARPFGRIVHLCRIQAPQVRPFEFNFEPRKVGIHKLQKIKIDRCYFEALRALEKSYRPILIFP